MNSRPVIFTNDVCRLCLWKNNALIPIFQEECEEQSVAVMINTLLPLTVSKDDRFPDNVCPECVYKLEMFYEFYKASARSHDKLEKYLSVMTTREQRTVNSPDLEPHIVYIPEEVEGSTTTSEHLSDPLAVEFDQPSNPVCLVGDETSRLKENVTVLDKCIPTSENEQSSLCVPVFNSITGVVESGLSVSCSQCSQQFTNKTNLLLHSCNRITYSHQVPASVLSAPISCNQCFQKFLTSTELSLHSCNNVTCCYCDKVFSNINELAVHKRDHICVICFSCRQCGIDFQTSEALKSHVKSGSCCLVLHAVSNDHVYSAAMTLSKKMVKSAAVYSCSLCNKHFTQSWTHSKHNKSKEHRHRLAQERWKIKTKSRIFETESSKSGSSKIFPIDVDLKGHAQDHIPINGESCFLEGSDITDGTTEIREKPKRQRRPTYLDNIWVVETQKRR